MYNPLSVLAGKRDLYMPTLNQWLDMIDATSHVNNDGESRAV